ncbi:type II secretion system protein N [Chitiniphilus shinanonensis]|uniref:type II secretion system protein N n=1 Tax=Chitiniphilus shinanonensis TaxID=553088 RepID=UPI00146BFE7C|nr:type II secretion system protein N [Chitiniphilus shinanonensis]
MPRIPTARLVRGAEVVLVAALAWVAAGLLWRVAAPPSPDLRLTQPPAPPAQQAFAWSNAPNWFGNAATSATATTLSAKLLAVIAGGEGFSAAIFTGFGAGPLAARPGDTLQDGVKLLAVERDRARIDNHGRIEEVPLEGLDKAMPGIGAPQPPDVVAVAPQSPSGPAQQMKVTRGVMADAMQNMNIADWSKGLANAPDGGIFISNARQQPFAEVLQLQDGDILKRANGRPLGDTADMSLVYSQFSQTSQVTLEVVRNGGLVVLQYQIQP